MGAKETQAETCRGTASERMKQKKYTLIDLDDVARKPSKNPMRAHAQAAGQALMVEMYRRAERVLRRSERSWIILDVGERQREYA